MNGKRLIIFLGLFYIFLLESCNGISKKSSTQIIPKDTSKSFKINGIWVTPKTSFDFNSFDGISGDTLKLVSCAEYIYSPFGIIHSKEELKTSLLKDFQVTDRNENDGSQISTVQLLKLDFNELILFFDTDREATKESYILKGEIHDNKVKFDMGIKIGMTMGDFYKTFFDLIPKELQVKFRVVKLSSCVDAITHFYDFKNGKLESVKFGCEGCTWTLDY